MRFQITARHERDDQDIVVGVYDTIGDALDAVRKEVAGDSPGHHWNYTLSAAPSKDRR